jgi:hypothetical protein
MLCQGKRKKRKRSINTYIVLDPPAVDMGDNVGLSGELSLLLCERDDDDP